METSPIGSVFYDNSHLKCWKFHVVKTILHSTLSGNSKVNLHLTNCDSWTVNMWNNMNYLWQHRNTSVNRQMNECLTTAQTSKTPNNICRSSLFKLTLPMMLLCDSWHTGCVWQLPANTLTKGLQIPSNDSRDKQTNRLWSVFNLPSILSVNFTSLHLISEMINIQITYLCFIRPWRSTGSWKHLVSRAWWRRVVFYFGWTCIEDLSYTSMYMCVCCQS